MNKNIISIMMLCLILSVGFSTSFSVQPEDDNPASIKIMSFNIHQYFVADNVPNNDKTGNYIFADLLDVIEEEQPDIIGLQEGEGARLSSGNIQGVAWLAEQLDMYYYYGNPTSEQTYGNPILSIWPILENEYQLLPRPEGIERVVTHIVVDSPFGELRIYNTHFAIGRFQEAQRQSAEFLLNYVGDQPAIITGDFNTAYNDTTYNLLNSTWTYSSIEAGIEANSSASYTSPAGNPRHKIDYIWLTSDDWRVIQGSYSVIGTIETSDHHGIVCELLPPSS